MDMIDNPHAGYRFLSGIAPYSAGVVAAPGYEVVRATLHAPLPYRRGFELIERWLAEEGRPRAALCAIELRAPQPWSFAGFADFNAGYVRLLQAWDLLLDGRNPIARTNVAPELAAPSEPALYAFSYTMPRAEPAGPPTFVVAGAGELPEGILSPEAIVRPGETSGAASWRSSGPRPSTASAGTTAARPSQGWNSKWTCAGCGASYESATIEHCMSCQSYQLQVSGKLNPARQSG